MLLLVIFVGILIYLVWKRSTKESVDYSAPLHFTGPKYHECSDCDGSGHCTYCHGSGEKQLSNNQVALCLRCQGTGKCKRCDGSGDVKY